MNGGKKDTHPVPKIWPPVYRPAAVSAQRKLAMPPANPLRETKVFPQMTAPPVYRPTARALPMNAPPVYRPQRQTPQLKSAPVAWIFHPAIVQRASTTAMAEAKETKETKEDDFEDVGAKKGAAKARKASKDATLAAAIVADAVKEWEAWDGGEALNCGWGTAVSKGVCEQVIVKAPAQGFKVLRFRKKDNKSAVNLQDWSKGKLFNYHVDWVETA